MYIRMSTKVEFSIFEYFNKRDKYLLMEIPGIFLLKNGLIMFALVC